MLSILLNLLECALWPSLPPKLSWEARKTYILPLLDVDNYIQLIDAVVKFNCFLTDLLPAVSVHFW